MISLDGSGQEPTETTQLPDYFIDTEDIFNGFGHLADRNSDELQFDIQLLTAEGIELKIELQDESNFDVFTRRTISGKEWQTISIPFVDGFLVLKQA